MKQEYNRLVVSKINKYKLGFTAMILLLIVVVEILLTCYIPEWRKDFYTVLKDKNASLFVSNMWVFFYLLSGLALTQGLKMWVSQLTAFQVRIAASKVMLKLASRDSKTSDIPAYSQAMTLAIQQSTVNYLEVVVELFISLSIVVVLLTVNISNTYVISAALLYSVIVSIIAITFNKPMITRDEAYQAAESKYREAVVNMVSGNGDYTSKDKFIRLCEAYYNYIRIRMQFTLMSRFKGIFASIIPYLLLGKAYFDGSIEFGDFMAGVATFELLVANTTIFIYLYPNYVSAKASQNIIKEFFTKIKK